MGANMKKSLTKKNPISDLLTAVAENCTIATARQSGLFSLCGLFLRLKDRYLWEHDLPPWNPTDRDKLLQWIDEQERQWLTVSDIPFRNLPFNGRVYHYFDHRNLNRKLIPLGYYYGSGLGPGMTPTFFSEHHSGKENAFRFRCPLPGKRLGLRPFLDAGTKVGADSRRPFRSFALFPLVQDPRNRGLGTGRGADGLGSLPLVSASSTRNAMGKNGHR